MTHRQNTPTSAHQLQTALKHAGELADMRSGQSLSAVEAAQAVQVGDLSVLMLAALRD